WQPFEYFFVWRHEPIYQPIPELAPLLQAWPRTLSSGLPFLVIAWPVLVLAQRFSGFFAVAMTPYVARDLSELGGAFRWPSFLRLAAVRATLAIGFLL